MISKYRGWAVFALIWAVGCSASGSPTVEGRDPGKTNGDAGSGNSDDSEGQNTQPPIIVPMTDAGPACGNAELDDGEICDDGNGSSGDGCSSDCELEDNFVCPVVGGPCERATVCGDGRQTGAEQCDDGNTTDNDGCTASCLLEADYLCSEPGEPCVSTVECGDSRLSGGETCDDGNTRSNDGCSDECEVEEGWACSSAGFSCQAVCGDGLKVGRETCDDGNTDDDDGCSSVCRVESGYACNDEGTDCHLTVCGDGVAEGSEPCDDGDDIHVGDGCSPGCVLEPTCAAPQLVEEEADGGVSERAVAGVCTSSCGDGILLAGDEEQCDDGNNLSGDGCDMNCRTEPGWSCSLATGDLPEELTLPILFRDFVHRVASGGTTPRHPDFQAYSGSRATRGLVEPLIGADGKPVYTGICEAGATLDPVLCPYEEQTTSKAAFDQWYNDTPDVNIAVADTMTFTRQAGDTYVFDSGAGFFPLDAAGWVVTDPPQESRAAGNHNFGFTSELRYWFEFKGGESLEFSGDDDVWVFVGGQLAVDIGGLHPRTEGDVTLDEATAQRLGLVEGRVYEIALFHAERHTDKSNFKLTIGGFVSSSSECVTECGDGIVAGDELCDDGEDNGNGYGFCTEECLPGPRCGDGEKNGEEQCDNGINLGGYLQESSPDACAPGCVLPPRCGDGVLNASFGEQCDDGDDNDGSYNGCNADCTLGPRCGDGETNGDEECDDGNLSNRDQCSVACQRIVPRSTK